MPAGSELLVCPGCGASRPAAELFCPDCRLPLVFDTDRSVPVKVSERHEWARKIKPQLAEGELVKVAWARNQAEGEFIQGLLLEEGVPSMLKRSAGFDVPDFLAAGPRDVLVPRAGEATAREVLLEAEIINPRAALPQTAPVRMFAGVLVALVAASVIVWLLYEVLR
jgi:uncharacterized protein YbaR (Trm112 family)